MSNFLIKSFRGGISPYEDKGLPGAFKFAKNADIRKVTDSFSANQALVEIGLLDYSRSPSASQSPSTSVSSSASPSTSASASSTPSPSASASPSVSASLSASPTPSRSTSPSPSPSGGIDTVFQDLVLFWVNATDGFTYGFGSTGFIYRVDGDLSVVQIYHDANGKIKGAEEKPDANGKTYLYWATDKVLKRKELPGKSDWNDNPGSGDVQVVSSTLSSADWHTMKQIGGGLKIANRDTLALVGYDNSFTNEALDLIPGNYAKTIVERNGRAIIGTYNPFDPTGGINSAIDTEFPLAQVGDEGQVYFANMSDSMPSYVFPGGGKTNPGGVCNQVTQVNFFEWEENALSWIDKQSVGNMALFGVYGATSGKNGIYSLGRKTKSGQFVMNMEYELDVDEIGAITFVNGRVLASYQDGSDFGVKATDLNNKAEAVYEGLDLYAPIKKPIDITPFKTAEIFMKELPTGCWVEFWYRVDKDGEFVQAKTMDSSGHLETTQFNTAGEQKVVFSIGTNGKIFEPKILIHPYGNTTPEIYSLMINFE